MDWSPELDATVRDLWVAGASGSQIAAKLGLVSRSAVISRAWRMGWQRPGLLPRKVQGRRPKPRPLPRIRPEPKRKPEPDWHARLEPAWPATALPILEAGFGQCRFPLSERPDWLVCGQPTMYCSSWCEHHYAICFQSRLQRRGLNRGSA